MAGRSKGGRAARRALLAWLATPLMLLAVLAAAAFVLAGPGSSAFGWSAGALLALCVLWILVSILWPARAERTCPECGADALERIDPETTTGVRCRACGYRDETASGWLMAEEEGPLEDVVMRQRGRRRADAPPGGPMDSRGEPD